MLTLCFGPSLFGSFLGTALAVLIGVLAVIRSERTSRVPDDQEPDAFWGTRGTRNLALKLRHPWKARISRVIGVD